MLQYKWRHHNFSYQIRIVRYIFVGTLLLIPQSRRLFIQKSIQIRYFWHITIYSYIMLYGGIPAICGQFEYGMLPNKYTYCLFTLNTVMWTSCKIISLRKLFTSLCSKQPFNIRTICSRTQKQASFAFRNVLRTVTVADPLCVIWHSSTLPQD